MAWMLVIKPHVVLDLIKKILLTERPPGRRGEGILMGILENTLNVSAHQRRQLKGHSYKTRLTHTDLASNPEILASVV